MKRAHLVEVRPVNDNDKEFVREHGKFIAIDSAGRSFVAVTEDEARTMCEEYNAPQRRRKEKDQ